MRCSLVKTDVVPLLTLAFNEGTIMGTIDIFQTIATQLGLTDEMVSNKVIMMREDLFIVQTAQGSIFRMQNELGTVDKFD